jgi:hypothetical protein
MTKLATVLAIFGLLIFTLPAQAFWTTDIGLAQGAHASAGYSRQSRPHYAKPSRQLYAGHYGHVSGECWTAARLGGPCGCEASKIAFGRSIRNLWLVSNWFAFPRTSPHVGAAAIWGHHHVEIVTAVHGDGTVSTAGSVGFSHVPIGRLRFVEPGGSYTIIGLTPQGSRGSILGINRGCHDRRFYRSPIPR